jgi:putative ABC transport system ATP-binding protein
MSVVSICDVSYAFQDGSMQRFILNSISYDFEAGNYYAIMGSSGSGKTTLLSLLGALDEPCSGGIFYDGLNITEIGYENYRRNRIGIVFQSYNLIPFFTALENVLLAMGNTDNQVPQNKRAVALNLLEYLGIDNARANLRVTVLSGGEQQRVAIARALSTNAVLILADEPTGNLDENSSGEISRIFTKLAHDHERCVIVVTHNVEIAQQADACLLLSKGKLCDMLSTA